MSDSKRYRCADPENMRDKNLFTASKMFRDAGANSSFSPLVISLKLANTLIWVCRD